MDIVYLAHFAGSPHHGMVYGHYYMAREWVRAGHRVTVVAASHTHPRFRQPVVPGRIADETIDGIRYLWLKTPRYTASDNLGRVRNILAFVAQTWLGPLPISRADVVIASSHYPFEIHPARRMARRHGALLVFEVRDLWPLTLVEVGGASVSHPFIRLMQWSEDYAYRHADKVVSVLAGARRYMVEHGMSPEKFVYIPNGVDISASEAVETLPDAHVKRLEMLRARCRLLVGYAGKVGASNALSTLVEALALCRDEGVGVAILGDGSELGDLRGRAERLGVSRQLGLLEPVRKAQVASFLDRMDAAYLGLQRQSVFRFGVSPTKLNDYMLAAKPVIFAVDAPDDIVAESGAGISCPAEDPRDVAAALSAMAAMTPAARAEMGHRGRQWIREHRDYRLLAARFLENLGQHGAASA